MSPALPFSRPPTVPLTTLRRFIQSREDDGLLLKLLRTQFDPIPAQAMLRHRLPVGHWHEGQVDGADFHARLIEAVERGVVPHSAPASLRPALRILHRFHFSPLPEIQADDLLFDSPSMGVRGKADLIGHIQGQPALVEIKTVHTIPSDYAHLEHSIQAAMLFGLAWDRAPRPGLDRVSILYVESARPHRAFLQEVQLPRRFMNVGSRLAAHLLGRN
jgi:hypothetical protein